ncbi:MAG TPA: hypothetical protein VIX81_04500 [Gammaproteobacteria bacterium]
MELWQQLLLGGMAAAALWLFLPGIRRAVKDSPRGSAADWLGLALPIGLVVLLVLLMISLL